ncbi:unnamed protein product, partial [Polarella glacialis]
MALFFAGGQKAGAGGLHGSQHRYSSRRLSCGALAAAAGAGDDAVLNRLLTLGAGCSEGALAAALGSAKVPERVLTRWLSELGAAKLPQVATLLLRVLQGRTGSGATTLNTIHYNAALSACAKAGKWNMALELLAIMSEVRIARNARSFSSAITACSKVGQWSVSVALLGEMADGRVPADQIVYNSLISSCAKAGRWSTALEMLAAMVGAKLQADAISYNTAISACSAGGEWVAALGLLAAMAEAQIPRDAFTYSSLMAACDRAGHWDKALALFDSLRGGAGRWAGASADATAYLAAIGACASGGKWQVALELLRDLVACGLQATCRTCGAAISACAAGGGQWPIAMTLLEASKQQDLRSEAAGGFLVAYNSAVSCCEKAGAWAEAVTLLRAMLCGGLQPDTVTFNSLISSCEKAAGASGAQWAAALQLLRAVGERKLQQDTISYNAAISACEKAFQWANALELFGSMAHSKVRRDAIAFSAAIEACEVCGQWGLTMDLMSAMLEANLEDCGRSATRKKHIRSYVHRFEAGGPVDCFKHVVLVALLRQMASGEDADAPFTYVDAHAGGGVYDLGSEEAQKLRNFADGVGRLSAAAAAAEELSGGSGWPEPVASYVAAEQAFNKRDSQETQPPEALRYYLGSPALSLLWLRAQDSAIFFETSEPVAQDLRRSLQMVEKSLGSGSGLPDRDGGGGRCGDHRVLEADSYKWLLEAGDVTEALFSGRGLVLVDPPYDSVNSYFTWNLFMMRHLRQHWPRSIVALWYPCLDEVQSFLLQQRAADLHLGDLLVAELFVRRPSDRQMPGSGFLVAAPEGHFLGRLFAELEEVLPALAALLERRPAADLGVIESSWTLRWLCRAGSD